MFTIHHQTNRISPVKVKTFSELGFTERKHLQEWLAHQADSPTAEAGEPPAQAGQPIDAATRICEFLDAPDLDEVKLNFGNSQRIMLVAANFRKEVSSTALWLLGQGISIQCFKVTPYAWVSNC